VEFNGDETMKQLLIATAALSLIGGAAFAQTANNPTNNPISDSAAPAGVGISGVTHAPAQAADGSSPTSQAGANMPPQKSSAGAYTPSPSQSDPSPSAPGISGSTAVASNDSAGSPPATYPVCTSKHEDRCVNRYQATRLASNNGMRSHHMKSMSSSTTTPTDQSSTATPGQ
jgi:hypothetical protein